jgi:hypothetical protein
LILEERRRNCLAGSGFRFELSPANRATASAAFPKAHQPLSAAPSNRVPHRPEVCNANKAILWVVKLQTLAARPKYRREGGLGRVILRGYSLVSLQTRAPTRSSNETP